MKFNVKLLIALMTLLAASVFAQNKTTTAKPAPSLTPAKTAEKKTNQRPVETAKADPFETADVKTLASQCVTLETAEGNIELEFFPESAPESVRNFLNLSATGAFDTTTFSRVVPDFVIQGGNLGTSEKWGSDLAKKQKHLPDEPNQIKHERGILSMARGDEPNSATTHFFILLREASTLDGKFAAFGRVTKGMDVVEKINKMPVENEAPKNPVKITRAKVATCAPAAAPE